METGKVTSVHRVAILGANGQLGTDLFQEFASLNGTELVPLNHGDLDVCDHQRVTKTLASTRPDVVINLAAFHKLEACEEDLEKAFAVNCSAVRNLAQVCDGLRARLVHLSSDYVFDGGQRTPYWEGSPLNPLNVYGVSKAAGEYFVRNLCRKHLVIRTSGLYGLAGASGKGGNFVETMLRLGQERGSVSVVTDQVLSPTYTRDLAQMVWRLVEVEVQGVVHVTNSGSCSWHEFAEAIFELVKSAVQVHPITTVASGSSVARPSYSVLDNRRLRDDGIAPLRPWREALQAYLEARKTRIKLATTKTGVTAAS